MSAFDVFAKAPALEARSHFLVRAKHLFNAEPVLKADLPGPGGSHAHCFVMWPPCPEKRRTRRISSCGPLGLKSKDREISVIFRKKEHKSRIRHVGLLVLKSKEREIWAPFAAEGSEFRVLCFSGQGREAETQDLRCLSLILCATR